MGEGVGVVPGQLLGDEPFHAGRGHDLGQGGRIAEGVGQPELPAVDAEAALEEALAVDDLAHQRLARRDVAVGLHPHGAHRAELAGADPLADPGEEGRVVLLHPGQVLGRRAHEVVLRVVLHQGHGGGEGAGALAHGLPQRPQPGGIDVGVAHGAHPRSLRSGGQGQKALQVRPGPGCAPGDVGGVEAGAGDGQGLIGGGRNLRVEGPGGQAQDDPQVRSQGVHLAPADGQLGPGQPEAGFAAGVGPEQGPVDPRHPGREGGVGRRLHQQLDWFPAGGWGQDHDRRMARRHPPARHPVLPDEGLPAVSTVRPVGAIAPVGVLEPEHDLLVTPGRRHRAGEPEPGGSPGRAPWISDREGLVGPGQGVGVADRLAADMVGLDRQGMAGAVDGRLDDLGQQSSCLGPDVVVRLHSETFPLQNLSLRFALGARVTR